MTIKELTLLSDNLAETKQFYTRILGLSMKEDSFKCVLFYRYIKKATLPYSLEGLRGVAFW